MRSIRFWILIVGSLFVCLLYVEQIYLSRAIYHQQQLFIEGQQSIANGQSFESSWKVLAARVYQNSLQDPALADVLKRNQIGIHVNKQASTEVPPTPAQAPTPVPLLAPTTAPAKASTKTSGVPQSKPPIAP